MSKYKNKDGISLNYDGDDSHKVLVREVITEAIKILDVKCKNHDNEDGFYKSIPRSIYEPELGDTDGI